MFKSFLQIRPLGHTSGNKEHHSLFFNEVLILNDMENVIFV